MKGHWPLKQLGDIFDIARGGSPRPIEQFITTQSDGLNWIKISDATSSGKYIERTKEKIRPEGLSKTRAVSPGDFLLTNSMSFGRPYIMATHGCIHDGWLVLKPSNKHMVCEDYFYYLLGSDEVYSKFSSRAGGSTVKNLNTDIVSSIEIPLPPLDEQRRIAAILDKADALRRKRMRALQLLGGLTQCIFLEMFGDPRSNERQWQQYSLADIGTVETGKTPPTSNLANFGDDYPFITPADLESGEPPKRYISQSGAKFCKIVAPGSAMVCCIGATIGKMDVAKVSSTFNQQINSVSWNERVVPDFGISALRFCKQEIIDRALTTTLPILKKSEFQKIEIIVPPLQRQIEFSKRFSVVDKVRNQTRMQISNFEAAFASLQHRAFTGQL